VHDDSIRREERAMMFFWWGDSDRSEGSRKPPLSWIRKEDTAEFPEKGVNE